MSQTPSKKRNKVSETAKKHLYREDINRIAKAVVAQEKAHVYSENDVCLVKPVSNWQSNRNKKISKEQLRQKRIGSVLESPRKKRIKKKGTCK